MRPVQPRRGPRQTYRQTIASRGDMTDHPLDQGDNSRLVQGPVAKGSHQGGEDALEWEGRHEV